MKEVEDVVRKINTEGCIPAIQALIEGNLYPVGGIAIGIALSQVIRGQNFLLDLREADIYNVNF